MSPMKRSGKKGGRARGPSAKTIRRAQDLYSILTGFIRVHGYPPTFRELGALSGVPSTSMVHYYLQTLVGMGLIELGEKGTARSIRVYGMLVQPPSGIYGRLGADYTREELERALSETRDALLSMYADMGRQIHWRKRTMHPVEVANLAKEVSERFRYRFELLPEEFKPMERE